MPSLVVLLRFGLTLPTYLPTYLPLFHLARTNIQLWLRVFCGSYPWLPGIHSRSKSNVQPVDEVVTFSKVGV